MNQNVRKFLIDQCVKGQPVYYETIGQILNLDLSIESHRQILSKTLGEISAYEHKQGRPLISSIAIYKQKNDHGYGFYSLCEELGIGKASQLSKELYGFTQMKECKRYWEKKENYDVFAGVAIEDIIFNGEPIKLALVDSQPEEVFSNFLRKQEPPVNGYSVLPEYNPSFTGVEINYIQESIDKKEIGDSGEVLVKQYEIQCLRNIGYSDLADQVVIVKDGNGYDVLSFDENRKPKYIEVKTTTGSSLTPFDYTINEKEFADQNSDSYLIYRLYNYDETTKTADFFVINNALKDLLLRPTTYKVYLKKIN